jgi:hypothetical protein
MWDSIVQSIWPSPKQKPPFINGTSLDDQYRDVATAINTRDFGPDSPLSQRAVDQDRKDTWKKIRPLFNSQGMEPTDAITQSFKNNILVGIGEQHTKSRSPDAVANLQYGIDHMKDYANAGATDMFIEVPKSAQQILDKYNNDPVRGDLQIPTDPRDLVGIDPVVAQGTIDLFNALKAEQPKYFELWKAAHDNHIALHAIDNDSTPLTFSNPSDPLIPKLINERDSYMAKQIETVIKSPLPSGKWGSRKGLVWLGVSHLPDTHGKANVASTFEILRQDLGSGKVASYLTQVGAGRNSAAETMFTVSRYLQRPVAVMTHDKSGAANVLGKINVFVNPTKGYNYTLDNWSGVIVFPTHPGDLVIAGSQSMPVFANGKIGK